MSIQSNDSLTAGSEGRGIVEEHDNLPNKPLVEALLEVKWGRPDQPDPSYPMIVGRLYERLKDNYPFIEDLPLSDAPPQIAVQSVRHRFRASKSGWPLVQVGPGVITLNYTESYTWSDFLERAEVLLQHLRQSIPPYAEQDISSLKLQYIDAIEFDYEGGDPLEFLRSKLHIGLEVPQSLFEGQPIDKQPAGVALQIEFPVTEPSGRVELRVSTGRRNQSPAILWHTTMTTAGPDAREQSANFGDWLSAAHKVTHHWFFALVQGDLLKGFLGK